MKTMTVREVRHNWPEVEASLADVEEIVITKHSKPIAKIVHYKEPSEKREQFNIEEHKKWMDEVNGDTEVQLVEKYLLIDREDRTLR